MEISIPARTYPSVPCEIIHAGAKVKFETSKGKTLKGAYQLKPTKVWDSALLFSADMYIPGTHMCCSFTGPYKTFKLRDANKAHKLMESSKHIGKISYSVLHEILSFKIRLR